MAARALLVVAGVSLGVAALTFVGVRSGMRKRCKKQVRKGLDSIPLVTDEWKRKQAKSICIGAAPTSTSTSSSTSNRARSKIRGQRQRPGAALSRRNVVAGELELSAEQIEAQRVREASRAEQLAAAPLPELLDAAFEAGADSVFVSRSGQQRYNVQISAHKTTGDRGRTVHSSATAWGKGKDATTAVRDALGQLDRDGPAVVAAPRRKALRGGRR